MRGEAKLVVEIKPDWVQADVAKTLCGVPKPTLMRIAGEGKVRSRRCDDDPSRCNERTTRVYRYQDILDWMDNEAIDPVKAAASGQAVA
jgi:hypothetical protein